jgi:hypothetical protein
MDEIIKVRSEYPPTVPLSVLALDLAEPAEGWPNFLGARAIAIIPDDLGRDCVSRQAARRLLDERREEQLRQAALRRLAEQEAVEADERRRAQIWKGVPASAVPDGVHPATAMLQQAKDAQPRRTPSQVEWLFGETDTMVYHELPAEDDAS